MAANPVESNQLARAASPYLLQHADNPVHWVEWSDDALRHARAVNKPILLSVGYAACHWCHVMAHESFEDPETAKLMNDLFVNIKVDREERPDIDQIYMAALHAMGEQGGWPLTMFLTPDAEPFWGGTYFPPRPAHGRPAFRQVLQTLSDAYHNQPEAVAKNSAALVQHLARISAPPDAADTPDLAELSDFQDRVLKLHDPENGGIRGAPKFPNAPIMECWARHGKGDPEHPASQAFLRTVERISNGGIYDHLAGGIARYSVDDRWLVPHFEKMLYDNAHFLRHLVLAHKMTGDDLFRVRIEETIAWLETEMRVPDGAYASSLDADSEGEEGKYYVWQSREIEQLLGDRSEPFSAAYDVSPQGNWEGKTILNRLGAIQPRDPDTEFVTDRNILLEARNKRVRPGLDDKLLTDWNAYLIRALAEAATWLDKADWLQAAEAAYHFISESNRNETGLLHSSRNRVPGPGGNASDHANMANAALSLFETTRKSQYLEEALWHLDTLDQTFSDDRGGYYLNRVDAAKLVSRPRCDLDEANPSASSQALEAIIRAAALSGREDLTSRAESLVRNQFAISRNSPFGMVGFMNALQGWLEQATVLVAATNEEDALPLIRVATSLPRLDITTTRLTSNEQEMHLGLKLPNRGGAACAIICRAQTCSAPITDPVELKQILLES